MYGVSHKLDRIDDIALAGAVLADQYGDRTEIEVDVAEAAVVLNGESSDHASAPFEANAGSARYRFGFSTARRSATDAVPAI
jgi:hypothetical protein